MRACLAVFSKDYEEMRACLAVFSKDYEEMRTWQSSARIMER